ncbi:MAG: GspE/PulE family protein [Candidatus Eutrophobiaceae bacterium]
MPCTIQEREMTAKRSIDPAFNQKFTLEWLLEALSIDGLVNKEAVAVLRRGREKSKKESEHPLETVAAQNWVVGKRVLNLEELTRWLADKANEEYLRIDPLKIDVRKMTSYVSQAYAKKLHILPVDADSKTLTIAHCNPFSDAWRSDLERITRLKIKKVMINPQSLERYLGEFFGVSRSIDSAMVRKEGYSPSLLSNFEQLLRIGKVGEADTNDQHVVSIVDWLLQFAFEQRASDIHLEPRREVGSVRFRIDGMLQTVHEFPLLIMIAICSRLKALGRMDVTDRHRPQDGRIKTVTPNGQEVEMRLSSLPTTFGEVLVLRIFDPNMLIKEFAQLGFSDQETRAFQSLIENPNGLILVTGPTGSGKTTTLYSGLAQLAKPELNVCTIEDPIEMVEPRFNQTQVQPRVGLSFASGVRTLLRQDPDVIMVGEIRDTETAQVSMQAALTGHLVLSTLHTNDSTSSIIRLMDIGMPGYLINATLLGIVAQRLVRMLCMDCRKPQKIEASDWQAFVAPHKLNCPQRIYVPEGCDECRHTGYLRRTGIYEILLMDEVLRSHISEGAEHDNLRKKALKQGMVPLKISAARRIAAGETTLAEVLQALPQNQRY